MLGDGSQNGRGVLLPFLPREGETDWRWARGATRENGEVMRIRMMVRF